MAARSMYVVNPTNLSVTVGTHTIPANSGLTRTIDDAASAASTDVSGLLAAGCLLIRNDLANQSYSDLEEAGRILEQTAAHQ